MVEPPPAPQPGGPEPGSTYAGFELVRLIGEGTFARVFEATSSAYPKPIALKVSREPVDSEATALRALREIRILGALSNPHVVHIYDHGMGPDERWYMVMELLLGGSLLELHDFAGPMQPAEAVRIVHQACLGLAEAHRAGIVHRDIKPENLWLLVDREVKVLDFGLARAWDVNSTIGANATMGHMLVGTPHYAQPEQVLTGRLTPASDVYSLGMILYELLTGHIPLFADEPWQVIRDRLADEPLAWLTGHVKQPIVPLDHYAATIELPPSLVDVVHATLAKSPEDRPADAGTLANALAGIRHLELGGAAGAILDIWYPSGAHRRHLVLPGVYRVGLGTRCEIPLSDDDSDRVYAIIEWTGSPREAELQPIATDGSLRINGHVIDYRVRLVSGTKLEMDGFRAQLQYPASMRTP
jgi:serine/threonine-protein kinase